MILDDTMKLLWPAFRSFISDLLTDSPSLTSTLDLGYQNGQTSALTSEIQANTSKSWITVETVTFFDLMKKILFATFDWQSEKSVFRHCLRTHSKLKLRATSKVLKRCLYKPDTTPNEWNENWRLRVVDLPASLKLLSFFPVNIKLMPKGIRTEREK